MWSIKYAIQLVDKFSANAKKIRRNLGGIKDSMKRAGMASKKFGEKLKSTSAKAALGFLLAGREILKFETSMNNVKALTNSTGEVFLKLRNQAKELGRTTRYSASEAANAQAFLAKAGFSVEKVFKSMPHTLNLAASANMDIASAADIVSNVMSGYRLEANELESAVDVLAKVFTTSNTDLNMLGESFKYAGPVAKEFGLKIEETAAFIGMMGNAGIQGTMAGTALRGALVRLAKPSKTAGELLRKYNIHAVDSAGKVKNLDEVLGNLAKRGAKAAEMMEIFGLRAGPGMMALSSQGKKAMEAYIKVLASAQGTAKRIADTQLEGLPGAFIMMKSAVSGLMIELGDAGLTDIFKGLANAIRWVSNLISKMPGGVKLIIVIFAAMLAVVAPLAIAVGGLAIAFGVLSLPILIVVGAVTALVAGLALVITYWKDIKKFAGGLFSSGGSIKSGVESMYNFDRKGIEKQYYEQKKLNGGENNRTVIDGNININAPKGAVSSAGISKFGSKETAFGMNLNEG